ncbi:MULTISPECIES: dipeptidase [unclassified Pseudomonas]|uniref:dipeptidase n=1 Tax=Pseudomonas TaxID=286 RepID=UPI000DABDDC9|nr:MULTISPECIES: dipeptidase [unclassified Pseudomonas]PZW77451.1 membrane dipeptidase [Pseudomonas sp. 2848]QWA31062.1 dipeptidase [Pseudomonas sp. RC3H12]
MPSSTRYAWLPLALACSTALADVAPSTRALHERLIVLDSHLDTPMQLARPGWDIGQRHRYADDLSQVDLPRMRDGGLDGGFFAIFTPQGPLTPEGRTLASEHGLAVITRIRDMVAVRPDAFALATRAQEVPAIVASGRRVVLISMENAEPLAADPGRLATYHRLGLRMLGLVHAQNNDFADSATALPHWHGLSPAGRELVQAANRLGILIDVSHTSDAVFDQVLALSRAPVIASHSGARAIGPHPRNLDDARLRQLAAGGGVVQVNTYASDLVPRAPNPARDKALAPLYREFRLAASLPPAQVADLARRIREVEARYPLPATSLDDFMAHLLHILDVVGPRHVGIGADWDGGGGVAGLRDVSDLPEITARLLAAGYSEQDLADIWGGNLLRVMEEAQAAAAASSGVSK